ncbi:hypothetical protein D3C87_1669210 [compost metagenome]
MYLALVLVGEPLVNEFVVDEPTPGNTIVPISTFSFAATALPLTPLSLTSDGTDGYSPCSS